MMVFFDFMGFFFVLVGSFIVMVGSSWFMIWVGFEINMFSFIFFVGGGSSFSGESVLKYYFVQVFGSVLLLFFVIFGEFSGGGGYVVFEYYILDLMAFVFIFKMGGSPFQFWFLIVIEGLDWIGVYMLMTWQKLAPLFVLSGMEVSCLLMLFFGFSGVLVGGLGGFNQLIIRSLMGYSSVSHVGWMGFLIVVGDLVVWVYYLVYVVVSGAVVLSFFWKMYYHVGQIYYYGIMKIWLFWGFFISLFSLGGLPPFLGFFSSWIGLLGIFWFGYYWVGFMFLLVGILGLYYYLRMAYVGYLFSGFAFSYEELDWELGFNYVFWWGSIFLFPVFIYVVF